MPRPLARLDGDSTRLACGLVRHQAPSTLSPNAVSAAPSGRGLALGSRAATPWAMVTPASADGDPDGVSEPGPEPEPHPASTSPTTAAIPAAAARTSRPAPTRVMSRLWVHPRDLGPDPGDFGVVGHPLEVVPRRVRALQLGPFVVGQLQLQ